MLLAQSNSRFIPIHNRRLSAINSRHGDAPNTSDERSGFGTAPEVANYLRTTTGHLANLRYMGRGPAWVKLGRSVRYRWSDVDAWVAANVQNAGV